MDFKSWNFYQSMSPYWYNQINEHKHRGGAKFFIIIKYKILNV